MKVLIQLLLDIIPFFMLFIPITCEFFIGYRRGSRKELVFIIHDLIALGICIAIYIVFVTSPQGDGLLLEVPNKILGAINGTTLEQMLGMPEQETMSALIKVFIESKADNQYVSLAISLCGGYVDALINLVFHIVFTIALFVVHLVLRIVLYIFYHLFYSETARKRRMTRRFKKGKSTKQYVKHKKAGGIIGMFRGAIIGMICVTILGTLLYAIAGDGKEKVDDAKLSSEEYQLIYEVYQGVGEYGTSGIYGFLNNFKNKDNVPYYLFFAGLLTEGKATLVEDGETVTYKISLIGETGNLSTLIKNGLNILAQCGDSLLPAIYGDGTQSEAQILSNLVELLENPEFVAKLDKVIDDFHTDSIFVSLVFNLVDKLVDQLDDPNFVALLGGAINDDLLDMIKVLLKSDYVSPHDNTAYLAHFDKNPTIKLQDLVSKEDAKALLKFAIPLVSQLQSPELDIWSIAPAAGELISSLSIFKDSNKAKFNAVLGRIYYYAEDAYIADLIQSLSSKDENEPEPSARKYFESTGSSITEDEIYNIDFLGEIKSLISLVGDVKTLYLGYSNSEAETIWAKLDSIFDSTKESYNTNVTALNNIIDVIESSKLLSRVLNTDGLMDLAIDKVEEILGGTNLYLPNDFSFSNQEDGQGHVVYGELACILETARAIVVKGSFSDLMEAIQSKNITDIVNIGSTYLDCKARNNQSITDVLSSSVLLRSAATFIVDTKLSNFFTISDSYKETKGGEVVNLLKAELFEDILDNVKGIAKVATYYDGETFASIIESEEAKAEFEQAISNFHSSITLSLAYDLVDQAISRIDEEGYFLATALSSKPQIKDLICVVLKKDYVSEHDKASYLSSFDANPYIKIKDLLSAQDLIKIIEFALPTIDTLKESENKDIFALVADAKETIESLSMFSDSKKEEFNAILGRLYYYAEDAYLEGLISKLSSSKTETPEPEAQAKNMLVKLAEDTQQADPIFDVDFQSELKQLLGLIDNVTTLYDAYKAEKEADTEATKGIIQLIDDIFDSEGAKYTENLASLDSIISYFKESRMIQFVLDNESLNDYIENTVNGLLGGSDSNKMYLGDGIKWANTYDTNNQVVEYGEITNVFDIVRSLIVNGSLTDILTSVKNASSDLSAVLTKVSDILEYNTVVNNRKVKNVIAESDFVRSAMSFFLITKLGSTITVVDSCKEVVGETVVPVIKEEIILDLLNQFGSVANDLYPYIAEANYSGIINYIKDETHTIIENELIRGAMASLISGIISDVEMLKVPADLKSTNPNYLNEWLKEDGELDALIALIRVDSIDFASLLNLSSGEPEAKSAKKMENEPESNPIVALLSSLGDMRDDGDLDKLTDSRIIHYTLSSVLANSSDTLGITIVVPTSKLTVLTDDTVEALVNKAEINAIFDVIIDSNIDLSASDMMAMLSSLISAKETIRDCATFIATIANIIVNPSGEPLVSLPETYDKNHNGSLESLKAYTNNPWVDEVYNILTVIEELFGNETINLDNVMTQAYDVLDQYDQTSTVVTTKTRLEVVFSSSIVSTILSDTLDDVLTTDLIDSNVKALAYNSGIINIEELKGLIVLLKALSIDFNDLENISFAEPLSTANVVTYLSDDTHNGYLIRGILSAKVNGTLESHPLAIDSAITVATVYTKAEVSGLLEFLNGISIENIDVDSFKLGKIASYVYNTTTGATKSYLLVATIASKLDDMVTVSNVNALAYQVIGGDNYLLPAEIYEIFKALDLISDSKSVSDISIDSLPVSSICNVLNNDEHIYYLWRLLSSKIHDLSVFEEDSRAIYASDSNLYKIKEITSILGLLGDTPLDDFSTDSITLKGIVSLIYNKTTTATDSYLITATVAKKVIDTLSVTNYSAANDQTGAIKPVEIYNLFAAMGMLDNEDPISSLSVTTTINSTQIATVLNGSDSNLLWRILTMKITEVSAIKDHPSAHLDSNYLNKVEITSLLGLLNGSSLDSISTDSIHLNDVIALVYSSGTTSSYLLSATIADAIEDSLTVTNVSDSAYDIISSVKYLKPVEIYNVFKAMNMLSNTSSISGLSVSTTVSAAAISSVMAETSGNYFIWRVLSDKITGVAAIKDHPNAHFDTYHLNKVEITSLLGLLDGASLDSISTDNIHLNDVIALVYSSGTTSSYLLSATIADAIEDSLSVTNVNDLAYDTISSVKYLKPVEIYNVFKAMNMLSNTSSISGLSVSTTVSAAAISSVMAETSGNYFIWRVLSDKITSVSTIKDHPAAHVDQYYLKTLEITSLIGLLDGQTLDTFDTSSITISDIISLVYNSGTTSSYLLTATIGETLEDSASLSNVNDNAYDTISSVKYLKPVEIYNVFRALDLLDSTSGISSLTISDSLATAPIKTVLASGDCYFLWRMITDKISGALSASHPNAMEDQYLYKVVEINSILTIVGDTLGTSISTDTLSIPTLVSYIYNAGTTSSYLLTSVVASQLEGNSTLIIPVDAYDTISSSKYLKPYEIYALFDGLGLLSDQTKTVSDISVDLDSLTLTSTMANSLILNATITHNLNFGTAAVVTDTDTYRIVTSSKTGSNDVLLLTQTEFAALIAGVNTLTGGSASVSLDAEDILDLSDEELDIILASRVLHICVSDTLKNNYGAYMAAYLDVTEDCIATATMATDASHVYCSKANIKSAITFIKSLPI